MKFDEIVITAANKLQAAGYREIADRIAPVIKSKISVVSDPGGERVGSLLATVNALKGRDCNNSLILVCHSGGDSKRLPAYAAFGKAFATIEGDGKKQTLFERIVSNMSKLALPQAGALVVCGDVAPDFDFKKCKFKDNSVTGIAYMDSYETASRHGVYVSHSRKVVDFLQKPSKEECIKSRALVAGKCAVDTGIIYIDPNTVALMNEIYLPKLENFDGKELDLYDHFTKFLVKNETSFEVNIVGKCDFFHIGTTRELVDRLGGRIVDYCQVPDSDMNLAGENVVTFIPRHYGPVNLEKGECLTGLPLKNGKWKFIKYRVSDDFKKDHTWERLKFGDLMKNVDRKKMLSLADEVQVELPLRIDFCGGWSDTPPICNDLGGTVLNASVALNGIKPVKACVKRLKQNVIFVRSLDLKKKTVITADEEIYSPIDPSDWCALVKAALVVVNHKMSDGGLCISISADVPKGSGMGTSSLLGAALLSALAKLKSIKCDKRAISKMTLQLEKVMGTNGGWQDQVGGLYDGVKLLYTKKGTSQEVFVKRLRKDAEDKFAEYLREHALLYFTGQKRMARNVLKGVLKFYEDNPFGIAKEIIKRLKKDSEKAFEALERCDFDVFAQTLNSYWSSKKALDPGSTNPFVESIIARIAPWTSAVSLCGAGGGGFMFILATDKNAKKRLKKVLELSPVVKDGRFFDFTIVT